MRKPKPLNHQQKRQPIATLTDIAGTIGLKLDFHANNYFNQYNLVKDCRRISKWLLKTAEYLEGQSKRKSARKKEKLNVPKNL
jgi:hypothetical protein